MIEEGIYTDLSSEDYHADKDSLSRSSIIDFKRSSFYFWSKHLNPVRPAEESKPALEFGNAFHTLILEPHKFEELYFVEPEKVLLKDVGKEKYEAFKKAKEEAEKSGKSLLSLADYYKLRSMQTALTEDEKAKELLEGAIYESSYFWRDKDSALIVKARPDILHENLYVDLKTCDDASPHAFQKSMAAYGYHIQAAMVKEGVYQLTGKTLNACINICVEKKYPYAIGIYIIDEAALETGKAEYQEILKEIKQCKDLNIWPSYEPQTIGLPRWYL